MSTGPATSYMDEAGTVETEDGATVAWRSMGAGRPIVMVHGITLDGHIWNHQVAGLARNHRVVTLDQRGHGDSSLTVGVTTATHLGADLTAVIEGLDLEGAVLVGHSLGGIAVLRCLLDHPEVRRRVAGAVLVSTLGTARVLSHAWLPVLSRLPLPLERAEEWALRTGAHALPGVVRAVMASRHVGRLMTRFALGVGAPEGAVAGTHRAIAETPRRVLRDIVAGLAEYHVHDELADLDVPTRVVCGNLDLITPLPLSRHLAGALPRGELVILDGSGHMPMWEQPDALTDIIAGFADGLSVAVDGVIPDAGSGSA